MPFCDCNQCKNRNCLSRTQVAVHRKTFGIYLEKQHDELPPRSATCTDVSMTSNTLAEKDVYSSDDDDNPLSGPEDVELTTEEILKSCPHDYLEAKEGEVSYDEVNDQLPSGTPIDEAEEPMPPGKLESTDCNLYFTLVQWICIVFASLQIRFNVSNAALSYLVSSIAIFLALLSHPIQAYFPTTVHGVMLNSKIGECPESLCYVVCPNNACNALYDLSEASVKEGEGATHTALCSAKKFGNLCSEPLMFTKRLSFGKTRLVPFKTFVFIAPSSWLTKLFSYQHFQELLKSPKKRANHCRDDLNDIWDGKIWKEFESEGFLSEENNIAFIMNVDWMQTFLRSFYKIGGIYMNVLNLPRKERMKQKWTLLIGLMPGPSEPEQNMNSFLRPIVDDLLLLWNGIQIKSGKGLLDVRAALLCVSSDLPAIRKISQFLGHKALLGCSRCLFRGERECDDCGRQTGRMSYFSKIKRFTSRSNATVKKQGKEWLKANNKTEAQEIAKKNGVRYSELARLPYFNLQRMCVVDPMHAFFLGLIEKETELHLSQDTESTHFRHAIPLNKRQTFYQRVKELRVPHDIGRLPTSLLEKNSLRGVTAEQWKNYAIIYARSCLLGLISQPAFECMRTLCEIIDIASQHFLTQDNLTVLDRKLGEHHDMFSKLYTKWNVSINNHMVLHIPEIFADYGPAPEFWCFSFERMNSVVVDVYTSNRTVEEEMTEKFLFRHNINHQMLENVIPFESLKGKIDNSLLSHVYGTDLSAAETFAQEIEDRQQKQMMAIKTLTTPPTETDFFSYYCSIDAGEDPSTTNWNFELLPPSRCGILADQKLYTEIKDYCELLYQEKLRFVNARIDKFARCSVNGIMFNSDLNRSDRSSNIMAFWGIEESPGFAKFYGTVRFYFKVRVLLQTGPKREVRETCLAYIDWFRFSNKNHANHKLSGLPVVNSTRYKTSHLIGVQRLVRRVVLAPFGKSKLLVNELPY